MQAPDTGGRPCGRAARVMLAMIVGLCASRDVEAQSTPAPGAALKDPAQAKPVPPAPPVPAPSLPSPAPPAPPASAAPKDPEPAGLFPQRSLVISADSQGTPGGILYLRNDAESGSLSVSLTASDFYSAATRKGQNARVLFFGASDPAGRAIFDATIAPKQWLPVRFEVSNLWEAGESTARLYSRAQEIGTLTAQRFRPPFNVKLTPVSNDVADIKLQRDLVQRLVLQNQDPMTYRLEWSLAVDSHPLAVADPSLTVAPGGQQVIAVTPDPAWFTTAGLLREEVRDGTLTLRFAPAGVTADPGWPMKVLPLKVHLRGASDLTLQVRGTVLLFLLLGLGGLCSLMLNNWLPNQALRRKTEARWLEIADRIVALSSRIDSRLRVTLRMARRRRKVEIDAPWLIGADLPAEMAAVTGKLDALSQVVEVVADIDRLRSMLDDRYADGVPPTRIFAIEDLLRDAERLLSQVEPVKAVIDSARAVVARAQAQDRPAAPPTDQPRDSVDEVFAAQLVKRAEVIKGLKGDAMGPFADLLDELRKPLSCPAGEPGPSEPYRELDERLLRCELLERAARCARQVAPGPEAADPAAGRAQALQKLLRGAGGLDRLREAEQLVKQMEEGIFPEDIEAEIRAKEVEIHLEPELPQRFQPVCLSVRFKRRPGFHGCAALREVACSWDFGHPCRPENGWQLWHYFPATAKAQRVAVRFAGKALPGCEATFAVAEDVQETQHRHLREQLVRVGGAVFFTSLGLLAGARDQVLKLDLIPAAVAVFLLGFGADSTIKNLLQPKEPTSR